MGDAPDKDCSSNYTMTLTLDLEIWFKVTAHPLQKGTLCVKYDPNSGKGRGDILRKRDLGWTDGRTEELFGCPSDPHIVWFSLISLYIYDAPFFIKL